MVPPLAVDPEATAPAAPAPERGPAGPQLVVEPMQAGAPTAEEAAVRPSGRIRMTPR